jgi:hypothetical protein
MTENYAALLIALLPLVALSVMGFVLSIIF